MQQAPQLQLETSVPADNANSLQRCHPRSHQSDSERSERQLTKQLDVNLLERVDAAELVKLMVNLVEDKSFVIVSSVVLHYVVYCKRSAIDIKSWDRGTPQGRLSAGSQMFMAWSVQQEMQCWTAMRKAAKREEAAPQSLSSEEF